MKKTLRIFFIALGVNLALLLSSMVSQGLAALLLITLPFLFMAWVDLGRALRNEQSSTAKHLFGILVGIPQVIFAFASIMFGIGIIIYFFFGLTNRSGVAWFMLLVSALMIVFGIRWLRDVFIQKRDKEIT